MNKRPWLFKACFKKSKKVVFSDSDFYVNFDEVQQHVILDEDLKQNKDMQEKGRLIEIKTLKIPQYLDFLTESYYYQLKNYIDSPTDFLENTDIGIAINYRLRQIWPYLFAYNMLYFIQAMTVTMHLILRTKNSRNGQRTMSIILLIVECIQMYILKEKYLDL